MPQPSKIPIAFAALGDKNAIPQISETQGLADWTNGFPAICSTPFAEGGLAPRRTDFNGIFNALSQAIMWLQQGGVYIYDAMTDYEAGNVVLDGGRLYVANAANGPSSAVVQPSSDTTGATWQALLNAYSPALKGIPTAPTASANNNSEQLATTAFVNNFCGEAVKYGIVRNYNLAGAAPNNTVSFVMRGNSALVFAMRGANSILLMFDIWTSAPCVLASKGSMENILTSVVNYQTITLTNNGGLGAIAIIALTGKSNVNNWPTD